LNASTAEDRTNYFFSLPSNQVELWFFLESERFRDPVFRDFYKERDVVMEERRLMESQPIGRLIEEFQSIAYKAHPYGEGVIGHMSDLQNLTMADGIAFFKKYYIPSNLITVVVGDVNPKRIRELAEIYFGRLPSAPKPEPLRTVEPPQQGERRVSLQLRAQRMIVMGFHKPDINHPDNAVYEALGNLLSQGRSSRLYRALVRDKKVATQVGGFPGFPGQKYPGLFLFFAFTAPGKTNDEVEKALDAEIERLKTELVTPEELDGVKRRARANLLRQLSSNFMLAIQLSEYQGLTGDWRNLFREVEQINRVTAQDIQRIAKATFTRDNKTVGTIDPIETASK
jgi:predicted Zn-dependent peptidase